MWRLAGCILESGKPLCAARSLRCVKSPLPPCLYSNRAGAERSGTHAHAAEWKAREGRGKRERQRGRERALSCLSPLPTSLLTASAIQVEQTPTVLFLLLPLLLLLLFSSPSPALFLLLGCLWSLAKYIKKGCLLIACYTLANSPCNIC